MSGFIHLIKKSSETRIDALSAVSEVTSTSGIGRQIMVGTAIFYTNPTCQEVLHEAWCGIKDLTAISESFSPILQTLAHDK